MKLLFIRHTAVDVEPGVCYGQTDVPLKDTFLTEADAVAGRLHGEHIDMAFSSPLSRCMRLARFCGFDSPVVDQRLMEMNFGDWEMKRYDEISDPKLQLWYDNYLTVAPTNGESSAQQGERVARFLDDLRATYARRHEATAAIFTHGGVIIHALTLLGGMSFRQAMSSQPGYGGIVTLSI